MSSEESLARVSCREKCGVVVWEGGRREGLVVDEDRNIVVDEGHIVGLPENPQALMSEYANASCPLNDCPHKDGAEQRKREQAPSEIVKELKLLRSEVEALKARK